MTWFRRGVPGPDEVGVMDGQIVALRSRDEVRLGHPRVEAAGFVADCAAAAAAGLAFGLDPEAIRIA